MATSAIGYSNDAKKFYPNAYEIKCGKTTIQIGKNHNLNW